MLRTKLRDFDWTLLAFVLVMSIISVLEIRSATATTKFHGFQVKQMGFIAGGLLCMFVMSVIDYHRLLDIAPWAYGISVFALVAVKVVGQKVLGARRWINLGHGIHFQPSEWVKLVLIIVAARFLWSRVGEEMSWVDIGKAAALIGLPMALVMIQPDLGTTLTYVPVLLCGLFFGG
ncbi:MAG TPA: FtsW/RodA/SpoVE family cell cycle protein, partial [Acidobacteriaceae bacterium]|nr:FtsW/RodA/SpoVE family cell cycle protein [Acidobacteriaceae bacterium]